MATSKGPDIEIRRSTRRRKSTTAFLDGNRFVVVVPAWLPEREAQEHAEELVLRLQAKRERNRPSDDKLAQRAADLSQAYLPGSPLPSSIKWVTNQERRWGSCTVSTGAIRISHRVQAMPEYVQDAVIVHELAHLIEPSHDSYFASLVSAYPDYARAQAFLEGFEYGTHAGRRTT